MRVWVGVALAALSACSWANAIDVCDRTIAEETVVNVRTDGDQRIESLQAASPTPDGNAVMVAYRSDRGGGVGSTITTSFVAATGDPLPSCSDESGFEVTDELPGIGHPSVALAPVPNPEIDAVGLLVYTEIISPGPSPEFEVVGVTLRRSGCAYEFLPSCDQPGHRFVIAREQGVPLEAPQVVAFDADGYVVVWTRSRGGGGFDADSALRARRIRFDLCADFPGHELDATGAPANLLTEGNQATRVSVAPVDEDTFFLLWYEERVDGYEVMAAAFDETLEEIVAPFEVATSDTRTPELLLGPVDQSFRAALGWDGQQLLAAWVGREDPGGPSHVYGRFFDREGRFLRSEDAPEGEAFRIGTATAGSESDPAVSALPSGGFLVAWTEQEEPGRPDQSGTGIRAALFSPDGSRSFSNQLCGVGELALNSITNDRQSAPAVARLHDGTTAVLWNDSSGALPDRDGSAVRAVFLPERTLLPVE